MNEYRYTDLELRQDSDGRPVVSGIIIRYGDIATFPWGTEEIRAGAFGDVEGQDLIANRMHQRTQPLARSGAGLRIVDSPEAMRAEVTLPDTSVGRDTAAEVAARILRGLSLEFRAIKDTVDEETRHRVLERGQMFGFGVVDKPAYPGSVAMMKRWADYFDALRDEAGPEDDEEEQPEDEAPEAPVEENWAVPLPVV